MMTGRRALMETLLAHGVRYIFGNPGSTESPFMVALEDYPQLQFILGLQEAAAVGMADGYARLSGKVGFAHLHIAAGVANGLSGLYNAHRGGTPLVITAGQSDTRLFQEEPTLWADLAEMARPFAKWSTEILHPADVPLVLRRAFQVALEPPSGPVFVSLPMNVLDGTAEMAITPPPRMYPHTRPDQHGLQRAAELLAGAARPLLLAGDRLAQAGGTAELVALAELLGAPVYTVNQTDTVFPTDHPLFRGVLSPWAPFSREALHEADVVLNVGANLFNPFMHGPRDVLLPTTRLIHLDANAWELSRIYPAEVALLCDPRTGVAELSVALAALLTPAQREAAAQRLQAAQQTQAAGQARHAHEAHERWEAAPITPARLTWELAEVLPERAIVIDEALTTSGPLHRAIKFSDPGSFLFIRGGAIGWGFGAALGAKLARPDQPVVAVLGDGAALFTPQALWTAAHHRLSVTYIICNNHAYRILKINTLRQLGPGASSRFIGLDLTDPEINFAQLATAFGVRAWRVEQPAELRPALVEALRSGAPALVDVVLDGSLGTSSQMIG
jgi:benzoylformate decarboxylase